MPHVAQVPQPCPADVAGGCGPLLSEFDARPDLLDADHDLRAELRGRRLAAVLVHQALDRLLEAVLAQAGAALVQMLTDLGAIHVRQLAVQVVVDPVQDLGARRLVRLSATHRASSPAAAASGPVFTSPRSDA